MTVSTQPIDWFVDVPLLPSTEVRELGPMVVVAPHPDDEVLGCGGIIALLRQARVRGRMIIAGDGAASHPGSKAYPPPALGALRRAESEAGLGILGVSPEDVTFLGLPDGGVPLPDASGGRNAAVKVQSTLQTWSGFETIVLPWR